MTAAGRKRLEDHLEPPYKSSGEAQVDRLLDAYGIPFFYEQSRIIHDRGRYEMWQPDFTLPAYNGLIIEYADMMDVPKYALGIRHKQRAYAANEIPTVFVYQSHLNARDWSERLIESICRTAELSSDPYMPAHKRAHIGGYR